MREWGAGLVVATGVVGPAQVMPGESPVVTPASTQPCPQATYSPASPTISLVSELANIVDRLSTSQTLFFVRNSKLSLAANSGQRKFSKLEFS
jgi:hypothetical protein